MTILNKDGIPNTKGSGVYAITNTNNGKVYIGSSLCIRGRLSAHRSYLRRGVHDNEILQRAWMKHGEAAFEWSVLELCDARRLVEREQYWINTLDSIDRQKGYNIAEIVGSSPMTGRHHSEESKAKMSEAHQGTKPSETTLKAAIEANTGTPRSLKVRAAIRRDKILNGQSRSVTHQMNGLIARKKRQIKEANKKLSDSDGK